MKSFFTGWQWAKINSKNYSSASQRKEEKEKKKQTNTIIHTLPPSVWPTNSFLPVTAVSCNLRKDVHWIPWILIWFHAGNSEDMKNSDITITKTDYNPVFFSSATSKNSVFSLCTPYVCIYLFSLLIFDQIIKTFLLLALKEPLSKSLFYFIVLEKMVLDCFIFYV